MDYRIFVGAFPGGELAERIQAVRRRIDSKTAAITPPHVTLAGTYARSGPPTVENERGTMARLQALAGQVPPFGLELGGIDLFPGDTPVIYLKVALTPALLAARAALLGALGADKHADFVPHLTLAMRLPAAAVTPVLAALQNSEWQGGRFTAPLGELCLMQRGPADPAWRCIDRLALS